MMDELLSHVPALATGGLTAGAGFAIMLKLLDWLGGHVDARSAVTEKREARADVATQHAFERLDEQLNGALNRIAMLAADNHVTREELAGARQQLAECLKKTRRCRGPRREGGAREQAMGDGRQHAALIVAQEKAAAKVADRS